MSASGKSAIVTGAAQGLGKAFTEILLKNGAKVGMLDYNLDKGRVTLTELQTKYGENKVMFMQCDVTNREQMKETFETFKQRLGGLDIVINNAGVGIEMGDMWEKTIDVNVKGTIRGTLLGMEHMRKDKGGNGGVIVNVASMAGINPNPCSPIYSASKSAIIMFSQSWSKNPELAANGVRINILAPAFVETPLLALSNDITSIHLPDFGAMLKEKVGIMQPETVAEAMFELVDDQNKAGTILKISKAQGKQYSTSTI